MRLGLVAALALLSTSVSAETVDVKYAGRSI